MSNLPNDDGPGLTHEEIENEMADESKTRAFGNALRDLAREDVKYLKNKNIYDKWGRNQRLRWIERVTADAEAGKNTIGADVVTRVVMNRLAG